MKSTLTIIGLWWIGLLIVLPQAVLGGEGFEFYDDLPTAISANAQKKPYVLYFGASWCGPCRRMKANTLEPLKDNQKSKQYQWLKYDIDQSPEVATRFGIVSVPSIVVLDGDQNPVGISSGFVSVDALFEFVTKVLSNPQTFPLTTGQLAKKLERTDPAELEKNVRFVLLELSAPGRPDRDDILEMLAAQPDQVQRQILNSLSDTPLAIRAAATEVLTLNAKRPIEFDPFAPSEQRKRQVEQLREDVLHKRP